MLIPSDAIPVSSALLSYDKIVHTCVFALLSGLIAFGVQTTKILGKSKKSKYLWVLVISIAYSAVLELLQQFSPGRMADLYDLVANVVGTVIGIIIFHIFFRNRFVIDKPML